MTTHCIVGYDAGTHRRRFVYVIERPDLLRTVKRMVLVLPDDWEQCSGCYPIMDDEMCWLARTYGIEGIPKGETDWFLEPTPETSARAAAAE